MKRMYRNIFLAAALVILVSPLPAITAINEVERTDDFFDAQKEITQQHQTQEYYAVIASCSDYLDSSHDIPKKPFQPISDEKSSYLYDALLASENWKEDNIIFLLNENASKEKIMQSLETMAERVGPEDIFLFAWSGHGTIINDTDGDELKYNASDRFDEAICPYDISIENNMLNNCISDDELNNAFSNISAKGLCLIFESCFSGGLISEKNQNIATFTSSFKNDLSRTESAQIDLDQSNRVIIMSTLPNTVGMCSLVFGWSLMHSLSLALTQFQNDANNDGYISIEEAFKIAKPIYTIESSLIYIGEFLVQSLLNKIGLYKTVHIPLFEKIPLLNKMQNCIAELPMNYPLIVAFISTLFTYYYIKYYMKEMTGISVGNNANIFDAYDSELPLIQL